MTIKTLSAISLAALAFTLSPAFAENVWDDPFYGVEMATLEVGGTVYEFPVADDTRRDLIYYMKKAMKGDQEAQEMFMRGKELQWFFIGKETPLWLKATKVDGKFNVEIVDPNKGE